jgi:hypothetical protein
MLTAAEQHEGPVLRNGWMARRQLPRIIDVRGCFSCRSGPDKTFGSSRLPINALTFWNVTHL